MIDDFLNTPLGIAVYSVLVIFGLTTSIWIVAYGAVRLFEYLTTTS